MFLRTILLLPRLFCRDMRESTTRLVAPSLRVKETTVWVSTRRWKITSFAISVAVCLVRQIGILFVPL